MEGNDKLVALLADQVVSRFIHGKVVNRLVTLLGLRWSSSLHRQQCSPIVQSIVVQGKLGGIDTDAKYISLKATGLKGDFHMLQQLQYAHNKTAKNHRDKVRTLVAALFDESFDDPILDAIKLDLFGVEDGGRIVPRDHPTLQQMRALPPPLHNGMHPSAPTRALSACAHVTLRAGALRQVTRCARALRRVTPHARALSRKPDARASTAVSPEARACSAHRHDAPARPAPLCTRIAALQSPRISQPNRPPSLTFRWSTHQLF